MSDRCFPKPPTMYRRMSIHGEMPVSSYNMSVRRFNTSYRQPRSLGTIPESPENANMTVADAIRTPKAQAQAH